jgi:hypothetical protein
MNRYTDLMIMLKSYVVKQLVYLWIMDTVQRIKCWIVLKIKLHIFDLDDAMVDNQISSGVENRGSTHNFMGLSSVYEGSKSITVNKMKNNLLNKTSVVGHCS